MHPPSRAAAPDANLTQIDPARRLPITCVEDVWPRIEGIRRERLRVNTHAESESS
jgi:hypothetical protein